MPYLILVAGLLFLGFGLYRFFLKASPKEVRSMFMAVIAIAIAVGALFLAVTGRLPIAMGLLVTLWPLGVAHFKRKQRAERAEQQGGDVPLTTREAYDILGIPENADEASIREAHLRLLKKVHPDQAGSEWLAKRINAARDFLLNRR